MNRRADSATEPKSNVNEIYRDLAERFSASERGHPNNALVRDAYIADGLVERSLQTQLQSLSKPELIMLTIARHSCEAILDAANAPRRARDVFRRIDQLRIAPLRHENVAELAVLVVYAIARHQSELDRKRWSDFAILLGAVTGKISYPQGFIGG